MAISITIYIRYPVLLLEFRNGLKTIKYIKARIINDLIL